MFLLSFSVNASAETTNRQALSYDSFQKFKRSKEQERQGHFAVCKRKKKEQVSVS